MIQAAIERSARKAKDPTGLRKIEKYVKSSAFSRALERSVSMVTDKHASPMLRKLKANAPAMLRRRRVHLVGFEKHVYRTWQRPLDLLEMLVVIAAEAGELASRDWQWEQSKDEDLVFDVLQRLHARGCQVASEVLTLLRAGYPSGAHARWRTLHETAVTALFIGKHGKELAERYLAHEYVESFTAAERYQKYCRKLGYSPYSKKEMAQITADYDRVVKQYGAPFAGGYGWAATALGRSDRFGFAQVEAAISLDHLRPYYQMASHAVHANPKAIRFSLALKPGQDVLLTGPSNFGLADPGDGAAISLYQLTVAMLVKSPSLGSILSSKIMGLLVDEIGNAFLHSQAALAKKSARGRGREDG